MAAPYWSSEDKVEARLRLGAVFALTLATTGISVGFSFLGRDFYNSLASKFLFFFSPSFGGVNLLGQFKLINIVLFVFFYFCKTRTKNNSRHNFCTILELLLEEFR